MLKRFLATITTVALSFPLLGAPIAQADSVTGPWTWTDLSGQLTERTNRPIWAVANANNSWFYTDGQDLWNGGQVYRYDGFTQINITSDVRNAGLNRVDDIVSDGQTILFLQDVVRMDNQLKVVAYRNGQYVNITNAVRNVLNTNEGVSSINGKNGTWMIVTTQARLFRWDGSSSNPMQISLPSGVLNLIDVGTPSRLYSVNHGSAGANGSLITLAMVPLTNNQWMLMGDPSNDYVRFYRYDGSTFFDVTSTVFPNADFVNKIVSNGTSVLISAHANGTRNRITDGSSSYEISGLGTLGNALVNWNGKSWMIVQGKTLSRLSGSLSSQYTENYGRTADKIVTIAGDANGRFLIGGALSNVNLEDPSFPLTAKLVMVTEGVNPPSGSTGSFGGDRVYTSSNGPRVTVQGSPSDFRVGNGNEFGYRVSATDNDGVERIELYINNAFVKTCYADNCEFRTTYFTNGQSSRSVPFRARVLDRFGNATETSTDSLTVDMSTAGSTTNPPASNTNTNGTSWTWLDPNTTTLTQNQSISFNVGAQDPDGIKRIEIVVNGANRRTCELNNATGNQTCSTSIYANDYAQNTNVSVNAKITDRFDTYTWTDLKTLFRGADNGSNTGGSTGNGTVSAWTSFEPSGNLARNASTQFRAGAWADRGLRSIELWVNGSIKRTCDFSTVYGTQSCDVTIYGGDYAAGSTISANAKATDADGKVAWTSLQSVYVVENTTNNPPPSSGTDAAPSVWEWLEPNTSSIATNGSIVYGAGAWDEQGVRSITIWVNGSARPACTFNPGYGNQQCTVTLNGSSYTAGSSVFVNAVAKDANGREQWTSGRTFMVNGTGSNSGSGSNSNGTISAWSSSNTYRMNDSITFSASGSDADGVNRVELYVNSVKVKTCNGASSCAITLGPFSTRMVVTYGAVLFDSKGNSVSSGYKLIQPSN